MMMKLLQLKQMLYWIVLNKFLDRQYERNEERTGMERKIHNITYITYVFFDDCDVHQ